MRWLVSDVPNRTELQVHQQPSDPNQAVRLQVRVRDKKFSPLDNATVVITVTPVGVETNRGASTNALAPIRLTAEASPTEAGVYETTYVPRETGGYQAEAVVTDNVGMEVGRREATTHCCVDVSLNASHDTFGFQFANVPTGLSFHAHTCSV